MCIVDYYGRKSKENLDLATILEGSIGVFVESRE
jgi:hypothetical protein